jgi:hypothetical protein
VWWPRPRPRPRKPTTEGIVWRGGEGGEQDRARGEGWMDAERSGEGGVVIDEQRDDEEGFAFFGYRSPRLSGARGDAQAQAHSRARRGWGDRTGWSG